MVRFEVVKGRKSENDRLVRVWAYGEVFSLEALLRLLQILFESEDSCYPVCEGFQGKAMLLKAIIDVYSGIPVDRVLDFYKLKRKASKTLTVEKFQC